MCDPFLEREKELLKLNESINVKCNLLNDKQHENVDKSSSSKNVMNNNDDFYDKGKLNAGNRCGSSNSSSSSGNSSDSGRGSDKMNMNEMKTRKSCGVKNKIMAGNKSPGGNHFGKPIIQKSVIEYDFSIKYNGESENKNDKTIETKWDFGMKKDEMTKLDTNTNSNLCPSTEQNASNETLTEKFLKNFNIDMSVLEAKKEKIGTNGGHGGEEKSLKMDNILLVPNSSGRRNASAEGMIKFLKAKVTILQQELDLSHKENIKNLDNLEKYTDVQKKMEQYQSQANNKINNLKIQIQKLEQQNADMVLSLKEKDTEHQSLRKQVEELQLKLKTSSQSKTALEHRLQKTQDDLEYVRKNYHVAKQAEKDIHATLEQERKFYDNQLRIFEKQQMNLMQAHKYQLLLIDNLKRQNVLLEQAKLIQIAEKDFNKILDWNTNNDTNDVNEMTRIFDNKCPLEQQPTDN